MRYVFLTTNIYAMIEKENAYEIYLYTETVMGVSMDAMSKPDSDYIQAVIE